MLTPWQRGRSGRRCPTLLLGMSSGVLVSGLMARVRFVTGRYAANDKASCTTCCAGALCAAAEVMPVAHPVGWSRDAGCAKGAASPRSQHSRLLRREEGCVKRYAILLPVGAMLLSLPLPVAADTQDTGPAVPTGYDLLVLTRGQFQLYVAGIYEGQVLMASMVQAEPIVCIDPMLTRTDVAALCLAALPAIPDRMMTLPAAEVVMSILMKQHPCEAAGTREP